jgi:anti-sigma factor RsiW
VETRWKEPAENGVATMEHMMMSCTEVESKLADLLLDPEAVPAKVQTHIAECDACRAQVAELQATMNLLDEWKAPEPSPFFKTRVQARMREERAAAPVGWLARKLGALRASFAYGPVTHTRPLAAMALTVLLLLGGGTYLGMTDWTNTAQQPTQTAVVHDLQLLDSNAQILDQLESIADNNNEDGN